MNDVPQHTPLRRRVPVRASASVRECASVAIVAAAATFLGDPTPARADTALLPAAHDNTLYEESSGTISNGAGEHLFTGRTAAFQNNVLRRGLIAFDIAATIPVGSTINSVALKLNMSRGVSSAADVRLHRVLASWGEGTSDAPDEEGGGAPAAIGDATWIHRSFSDVRWSSPGGDIAPLASAITNVGIIASYTWSSPTLAADVQSFLDNPSGNFGWALIGDEEGFPPTAKRFDTRENADPANRPALLVNFTPVPAPSVAVVLGGFAAAWAAPRRRR